MARASFVLSMGPLDEMAEAQGHPETAVLLERYGISTFSLDGNITQDLADTVRLHIVVGASDPADVRGFVEEMYGN